MDVTFCPACLNATRNRSTISVFPAAVGTGDGKQDRGSARCNDLLHALDEKLIHFGICFSEIFIPHVLMPLEVLLFLLETV